MPLDIHSIVQATATINEAESLLLYTRLFIPEDPENWYWYDTLKDSECLGLIHAFCNHHGYLRAASVGTLPSLVPEFVFRYGQELIVEGASWSNGAFAHHRGGEEEWWQLIVRSQTAHIFNYPMPS